MIIDCKEIKENELSKIKSEIELLNKTPKLLIITAKDFDEASKSYIKNKTKVLSDVGIDVRVKEIFWENLDGKISMLEYLKNTIFRANNDNTINGIIVQLPLPYGVTESDFADCIEWSKDVDGFNSINKGRLQSGLECLIPCTAQGVASALDDKLDGKNVTIINRTSLVGLPLHKILLDRNATITMCHSKTKELENIYSKSDIIVTAVGKKNFINTDKLKDGCTIIDVAILKDEVTGKLCGDIPKEMYSKLDDRCIKYTTVPSGVGLLTCTFLAKNVLMAFTIQNGK